MPADMTAPLACAIMSWLNCSANSLIFRIGPSRSFSSSLPIFDRIAGGGCDDDVEAQVEAIAASEAAAELLAVLTPDQRAVVTLRVFGELTSVEVAEIVGKPVGAVKALYRRVLAALRRDLVGDADVTERPRQLRPNSAPAVSFVAHLAVTEST